MDKKFVAFLGQAIEAAQNDGFDAIELVQEDRDVEIFFYKGNTGLGDLANEHKKSLWQLTKKDIAQLKSELNAASISLRDYQHFGENARKLTIKLR